jgi:heme oxygenase (biliverdin-IX-beta and delta-forming)
MLSTAVTTAATLRGRLREACAEPHRRLDARLGALDLRRLDDYRTFLEISAAALLPLEAALVSSHVERFFPDWDRRSRSRAILADLARLGEIARRSSTSKEPGISELGLNELGLGGILGTMYVLEGSRLGARVLLRRALQSPHLEVLEAHAYLRHGAESNLWQSFLTALEFHGARLHDDRAAVRAARRAFNLFAAAASQVAPASPERIRVGA